MLEQLRVRSLNGTVIIWDFMVLKFLVVTIIPMQEYESMKVKSICLDFQQGKRHFICTAHSVTPHKHALQGGPHPPDSLGYLLVPIWQLAGHTRKERRL